MKHRNWSTRLLALTLSLCMALTLCVGVQAEGEGLSPGAAAIALIEESEGFRAEKYYEGGAWYIGYSTQCGENDYPYGITREEAEQLLMQKLTRYGAKLNAFFAENGITPTQGQFDALLSFCYNFSTGWLSGDSDLLQIVRGDRSATRLEVAQAFGEWCHSGGQALGGLAARRLLETSLYLDGDFAAAESEFAYLIVKKESGAAYETDFRVYQRGTVYGAFPAAEKGGLALAGVLSTDGETITAESVVTENVTGTAIWGTASASTGTTTAPSTGTTTAPFDPSTYTGKTYSDVNSGDWFYAYVLELSAQGVVNGYEDGTYQPYRATTAGELLKLVLRAAGHSAQAPTSQHWASGYATYALSMSYLTAPYTDAQLDGAISRLAVAHFAARVLGLSASSAASPFSDVNDGYVTALYQAGIFTGTTTERGEIVFAPTSSMNRAEAAAILCRISHLNAQSTAKKIYYKTSSTTYTLDVLENVPVNRYAASGFYSAGSAKYYNAGGVTSRLGIDVSQYQENVDWQQVAASGVSFVIARVGYRGYTEGGVYADTGFDENARGAAAAGLQVGAYFFSQAITVQEAQEEAQFVLEKLRGHTITGPVVFDWESIGKSDARTYGLDTQTLTDCANAFCAIIAAAGYQPMIYFNNYDGYVKYDLSQLAQYPFWYASYNETPEFYYDFAIWQYSSKGSVPGISGSVDMDLWFVK